VRKEADEGESSRATLHGLSYSLASEREKIKRAQSDYRIKQRIPGLNVARIFL